MGVEPTTEQATPRFAAQPLTGQCLPLSEFAFPQRSEVLEGRNCIAALIFEGAGPHSEAHGLELELRSSNGRVINMIRITGISSDQSTNLFHRLLDQLYPIAIVNGKLASTIHPGDDPGHPLTPQGLREILENAVAHGGRLEAIFGGRSPCAVADVVKHFEINFEDILTPKADASALFVSKGSNKLVPDADLARMPVDGETVWIDWALPEVPSHSARASAILHSLLPLVPADSPMASLLKDEGRSWGAFDLRLVAPDPESEYSTRRYKVACVFTPGVVITLREEPIPHMYTLMKRLSEAPVRNGSCLRAGTILDEIVAHAHDLAELEVKRLERQGKNLNNQRKSSGVQEHGKLEEPLEELRDAVDYIRRSYADSSRELDSQRALWRRSPDKEGRELLDSLGAIQTNLKRIASLAGGVDKKLYRYEHSLVRAQAKVQTANSIRLAALGAFIAPPALGAAIAAVVQDFSNPLVLGSLIGGPVVSFVLWGIAKYQAYGYARDRKKTSSGDRDT